MLTVGSLFSGVGGLELGLERTGGFETKWQCEIDEYACKVLAKHWPDVRRWNDVRTFPPMEPTALGPVWHRDDWAVDLICAGFPCQDISHAGKQAGIHGSRSGLFVEIIRLARLLRPRFLLLENVAALLSNGMGTVLGALAEVGYDAEWGVFAASDCGASHIRERVFILANDQRVGWLPVETEDRILGKSIREKESRPSPKEAWMPSVSRRTCSFGRHLPFATDGRMDDGISSDVDRLRCLGNAVVPACASLIGEAILEATKEKTCTQQ